MKFRAQKGKDIVEIEVTDDGLIKVSTDKVSQENHENCESVYRLVASMAGGSTRRVLKPGVSLQAALHAHTHDGHTHTH